MCQCNSGGTSFPRLDGAKWIAIEAALAGPKIGEGLEGLEGGASVIKATSAAHRTPDPDAAEGICELDGKVDGIRG